MTPDQAITMLDRQIAAHGQTVAFKRLVGTGPTAEHQGGDVSIQAHVRTLREDELIAGMTQNDLMVIVSPTGLAAWPFGIPKKGDKVVVDGVDHNIELPQPINVAGTLVRLNLKVKG
ncbi:hypothetical protein X566_20120 [Afipia sp. P52-10]|uniref:hypothetical protein n=1 Tax=Afipia sp. P52-10 TaxID=1429916 RepID=UPI0003DF12AD|nr:hypothetical protein [Afipia sp. P52-10]ETR75911.1 hypothetical protein X566_20120 [Afipia sp. P52-10]